MQLICRAGKSVIFSINTIRKDLEFTLLLGHFCQMLWKKILILMRFRKFSGSLSSEEALMEIRKFTVDRKMQKVRGLDFLVASPLSRGCLG